jgi:tRNA(Arg) A34 adenosine deaminase TadA
VIESNLIAASIFGLAQSDHHTYKIGAMVVPRKFPIMMGANQQKTHPRANTRYKYIHAEFDAYWKTVKMYGPESVKGATIYVARTRIDYPFGLAKPCIYCADLLQSVGFKQVFWSTPEGYDSEIFT